MDIQRVGIVGCGLMGAGIAQCAAEAGCEVWVKEADEALRRHCFATLARRRHEGARHG